MKGSYSSRPGGRTRPGLLLIAPLIGAAGALSAAEASLAIGSPVAYEGQTVALHLTVVNPDGRVGRPQIQAVPGLTIRGPGGPSQRMHIVNGQQTEALTFQYEVEPLAGQKGTFTIGPATVPQQGGTALRTNAVTLRVAKRPAGDGIRLAATVSPADGPVGATFRVQYTIYYSGEPYEGDDDAFSFFQERRRPFGLSGADLPILSLSGVKITPAPPIEGTEATMIRFQNGMQVPFQQGFEEDEQGYGYRTIAFAFDVVPLTTGTIEIPPASVSMLLAREGIVRDPFGRARRGIQGVQHSAKSEAAAYRVRDLPSEGRPPGFAGAVGKYQVDVKASPTEVDAFAPITLEVRVSGDGLIEELKPPAWSEVASLTRDFDVSTDVDSGKVEGKTKVFRQVIRARSEKVTEIPPVPFPYYDPASGKYEVASGKPIPIKVRAVKTVGADEAIPSARWRPDEKALPARAAPSIVDQAGIGANFAEIGSTRAALDAREVVLSPEFLGAVGGPPAALGLLALAIRLRRRDPRARVRQKALSCARAALSRGDIGWEDASRAYQGYFRDRLGLPAGEITPADLGGELERRGVPARLRDDTARILDRLLAGRFGGAGAEPGDAAREAMGILEEVERCGLEEAR
jgi:hypothetical protein